MNIENYKAYYINELMIYVHSYAKNVKKLQEHVSNCLL